MRRRERDGERAQSHRTWLDFLQDQEIIFAVEERLVTLEVHGLVVKRFL